MKRSLLLSILALALLNAPTAFGMNANKAVTFSGEIGSMSAKVSGPGISGTSTNSSTYLGAKLGYSQLESQTLGFILRAGLGNKLSGEGWGDYTFLLLEGNAAYSFQDQVYAFGGLNLNNFIDGSFSKFGSGIGFQVGLGFRITSDVFAEIQYASSNHSFEGLDLTFNRVGVTLGTAF